MVLAKKSIRRLWYPEPGHGGDIATRSETGLSTQQFNDAIPNEFWREVVDRVAQECPDTLLLAEAFWMMEGYFVRTLGMHRVYNSAFMNMLKKEENQKYRDTIKNTITFDPQVLKRYVNFMNNPDEETAIAQFGDGDKYFGVCTLMITMPGLPMFGHGQIEGFTEKYGMEYTKAYKDEKPSQYLVDRHWHDIFPLMKKRYLFSGVDNFLLYDLWEDGHVNENVFAYSNGCGNERAIVFYNNKYDQAHGWIKQSDPYAVKTGNGDEVVMMSRSVSEGLNLTAEDDKYCIFQEHRSRLWFIRKSREICEKGMFVMLNGFEYQVYMNVHQVTDEADGRYRILCETLNGKGCEDIETAWQEIIYKDLYEKLRVFAEKAFLPLVEAFAETPEGKAPAVTDILKDAEKAGLDFYKLAEKTAATETKAETPAKSKAKTTAKKPADEAAKAYKLFASRVKTAAKLHKAAVPKKPADLQKALARAANAANAELFAKLLLQADASKEAALLVWAAASLFAENGFAAKWNLGRKFNEYLVNEKLTEKSLRPLFTKILLLASKNTPLDLVELIVHSRYAVQLGGINSFDNIIWFNKELVEDSLNDAIMIMALDASAAKLPEIFKLHKTLFAAKLKAAYKADLFVKAFAPKPAKKATAKAKTPTKSKAPAKSEKSAKTPAKKPAAKPKASTTTKPKAKATAKKTKK